ncbi:olfactory receptor 5AN6-like [Hyperolius riggenbachi]|uniref:olfactory receptor 5AN6-like n=1 Tax=Hyperolius riggenbachi TaxID=752182 RepID=UPI0035A2F1A9
MIYQNKTKVTTFVLSGLTDDDKLVPFFFIFFLLVYFACVVFNFGMVCVVLTAPTLRTPMYFFLFYLSMLDLVYSSVINPKMLADFTTKIRIISFKNCAVQFFFFEFLVVTESLLLSAMAYDRYAAICHPLLYVSVMTNKKCSGLVLFVFSIGFLQSVIQTCCVFTLDYCGPNYIDNYYCDVPQLLKLACSSNLSCNLTKILIVIFCGMGPLIMILVSYSFIVFSILQMKSREGRKKAFSTCSSHLMCVSVFYGTVFVIYLQPSSKTLGWKEKAGSVFYTIIIPVLNPLIYSLRNQEVKRAIRGALHKCRYRRNWKN